LETFREQKINFRSKKSAFGTLNTDLLIEKTLGSEKPAFLRSLFRARKISFSKNKRKNNFESKNQNIKALGKSSSFIEAFPGIVNPAFRQLSNQK
jgi:hypothetical protein